MDGTNLVYWLILALIGATAFLPKSSEFGSLGRKVSVLLVTVALALAGALRYGIGFDYPNYEIMYAGIAATPFDRLLTLGQEPLFVYIAKLILALTGSYQALFAAMSVVFAVLVGIVIYKKSPLPWLSFYLLIMLQFFAQSMNFMRQSLAAAIFMFAVPYIQGRKPVPYMLLALLAASVHKSALIVIPVYFIATLPLNKIMITVYSVGTLLTFLFSDVILKFVFKIIYGGYSADTSRFYEGSDFKMVAFPLLLFIGCAVFAYRIVRDDPKNIVYANFMIYGTFFTLMFVRHFILERMAIYFTIQILIALPMILKSFAPTGVAAVSDGKFRGERAEQKRQKKLLQEQKQVYAAIAATVCVISALHMSVAINLGFHNTYPYFSIWSDYAKNKERVPFVNENERREQEKVYAGAQGGQLITPEISGVDGQ